VYWAVAIVLGTLALGRFISQIHLILPAWFPEAASYPYLDAFTTVMSFAAQWLLVQKRVDSWYLWVTVDVIGVWLYYQKGVVFVSLLYAIFLVIAIKGTIDWRKSAKAKVEKMALANS
jgi:nicotinamide mononucleotide transporter